MRCQGCGARFLPGDRECTACGRPRAGAAPSPTPPREVLWTRPGALATPTAVDAAEARSWAVDDDWVLVGDELVPAAELDAPTPAPPRRRRWPAFVGVAAAAAVLVAGARLGGDAPGPLVRVLPNGEAQVLGDGIARAPTERWRTDVVAGRDLTDLEQVGDRLVVVAPTPRARQGQDVLVLRASDGAQVWSGTTMSWSRLQPAIAGNTVVLVDRTSRRVQAVDLLTGSVRWQQAIPGQFVLVPAGRSDVVLVGVTGGLSVRQVDTGVELWHPGANRGGAALRDGLVLVDGNRLTAYDWLTGATRWSVEVGGPPTWVDGTTDLVLVRVGNEMVGLGAEDGVERWRRPWTTTSSAADALLPAGSGALLTTGSSLSLLDGASGRTVLSGSFGSLEALLTQDEQSRVFVRRSDAVDELDLRTGRARGTLPALDGVLGISRTILYGVSDDELRGYELSSLQPLWRVRLDEPATLVSAGSVLVLRTSDGELRALA